MKLGLIRRISKDDIKRADKDAPKWLDVLLDPLNDFIEKVGLALDTRLDFQNNFLGKVIEQTFTHDTEKEINPYPQSLKGSLKVIGVVPVSTGSVYIDAFKWVQKTNGNIGVSVKLTGATEALIRLQIQLG